MSGTNYMDSNVIGAIMLNIQMFADEFEEAGWDFSVRVDEDRPSFVSCALYDPKQELNKDILYLLMGESSEGFPVDDYCYVTLNGREGNAPHISIEDKKASEVLNAMLRVIYKYRSFERKLNELILDKGDLEDLLQVASDFFKNPIFVHDSDFCVLATADEESLMGNWEQGRKEDYKYLPSEVRGGFNNNKHYQETLEYTHAAIWESPLSLKHPRSMFVNLWDNTYYMGRIVVEEAHSRLKKGQLVALDYFAKYFASMMLLEIENRRSAQYRYERVFRHVLNKRYDWGVIEAFLTKMKWQIDDDYLCVKINSRGLDGIDENEDDIRRLIGDSIEESFCFLANKRMCVIINMTRQGSGLTALDDLFTDLSREYLLSFGYSNVFKGMRYLYQGFSQAEAALNAVNEGLGQWVLSFAQGLIERIVFHMDGGLYSDIVVAPTLLDLVDHDISKSSNYYGTLRAYIENERDIKKTSDELYIHRTTLLYRLEKINAILKMNLDDVNVRTYLLICFKLLQNKPDFYRGE